MFTLVPPQAIDRCFVNGQDRFRPFRTPQILPPFPVTDKQRDLLLVFLSHRLLWQTDRKTTVLHVLLRDGQIDRETDRQTDWLSLQRPYCGIEWGPLFYFSWPRIPLYSLLNLLRHVDYFHLGPLFFPPTCLLIRAAFFCDVLASFILFCSFDNCLQSTTSFVSTFTKQEKTNQAFTPRPCQQLKLLVFWVVLFCLSQV